MKKISLYLIFVFNILYSSALADERFNNWLNEFKLLAVNSGISKSTVNLVMNDAKFLSKVIEYELCILCKKD